MQSPDSSSVPELCKQLKGLLKSSWAEEKDGGMEETDAALNQLLPGLCR